MKVNCTLLLSSSARRLLMSCGRWVGGHVGSGAYVLCCPVLPLSFSCLPVWFGTGLYLFQLRFGAFPTAILLWHRALALRCRWWNAPPWRWTPVVRMFRRLWGRLELNVTLFSWFYDTFFTVRFLTMFAMYVRSKWHHRPFPVYGVKGLTCSSVS